MNPCILFRQDRDFDQDELNIARLHFPVYRYRSEVPQNSLVVGRNSVLPYYNELSNDLWFDGSRLINSVDEHNFVANVGEYSSVLGDMTFRTWTWDEYVRSAYEGPVVLKGATNSKKRLWKTHMFAQDREQAILTMLRLQDDDLVAGQGIYVRQFVPLVTYGDNVVGCPITEEYRLFMYRDQVLCRGYYWSSNLEDLDVAPDPYSIPSQFIKQATDLFQVSRCPDAYVMDVARAENGRWWVVELNSIQMSGLSDCNPDELYRNLRQAIDNDISSGKIS